MSDTLLKFLAPDMPSETADALELCIDKSISDNFPKVLPVDVPKHIIKRHLREFMVKTAAVTWELVNEGKGDPVKTLPASGEQFARIAAGPTGLDATTVWGFPVQPTQDTTPDAAKLARLKSTKDVGSYDTWLAVGRALHGLFDGKPDGFAHWLLWSTTAPAYANDWSNVMFMVTKYRNFGTHLEG